LCDLQDPARKKLVQQWEQVLNDLETDYTRCCDRLDWVAKLMLLREFQSNENISNNDPWLQSLDLEYHRLDRSEGLYYGLEQSGAMAEVPDECDIRRAVSEPPPTTRASIRGKCVQKFSNVILSAQWDHVTLQGSRGPIKISLLDIFSPADVARVAGQIDAARSPDDLESLDEKR
jgi:Pup amidohydrolase